MTRRQFYAEWVHRALQGANGKAQGVSLLLTVVFGAVAWLKPEWGGDFTMWASLILLFVFLAAFVIVWSRASYGMYSELEKENAELKERMDAPARRIGLTQLLVSAEQRLEKIVEDGKRTRPTSEKAWKMERLKAEFLVTYRSRICTEMEAVNRILQKNKILPLDVKAVTNADDFDEMCRLVAEQLEILLAIRQKL